MAKRSIKKEKNLRIELPDNVKLIISELEKAGYEAYAVGGCVRDSLIGRIPGDWDITTSALPQDIKRTFRRTVDTGIEHGTVTVLIGNSSYEVTTYRIDGEYKDSRHPSSVRFTDAISEDLRRRDFTINAMAYNDKSGIVDLFGGREDLETGVVRCVGDANERFDEDALRILRAVRFAAQLDFDIDSMTRDAIAQHAPRLKAVSKERVLVEISKLICSAHIERIADIFQLGIVPYIAKHFREINIAQIAELKRSAVEAYAGYEFDHEETIGETEADENDESFIPESAFNLCMACPVKYRYIRFAYLTEGMDADNIDAMLKDLKSDNITRKNTVILARHILTAIAPDQTKLKRVMSEMEPELFVGLLKMKLISSRTRAYQLKCADGSEDLRELFMIAEQIDRNDEPVYLSELAVSGADIISEGIGEGPEIGRLLHKMQEAVWAVPEHNTKEWLLANIR